MYIVVGVETKDMTEDDTRDVFVCLWQRRQFFWRLSPESVVQASLAR